MFWVFIIGILLAAVVFDRLLDPSWRTPWHTPTAIAKQLAESLEKQGLQVQKEYNDGHKSVDIAILASKLYIEVDGFQHKTDSRQALADLRRDNYSDKEGFRTIRVSNTLCRYHMSEICELIVEAARIRAEIKKK